MKIITTISGLRKELLRVRQRGEQIGFVPTMGYFHEGHLSLMRRAVSDNDVTVVSLFVNPLQFGPKEDLSRYPRDLKRDAAMAATTGVDILFAPSVTEMYPEPLATFVEVGKQGDVLCGAFRPGHFKGVATVVLKLLNIVLPGRMYLGQKDAQQVIVIKKMVRDLDLPVKIVVCPTLREADGLAMSSRNIFLSPTERMEARALSSALERARQDILRGETSARKIISKIKKLISVGTSATIEYIEMTDATDLMPVRRISGDVLVALAVRFSRARLIDNTIVRVK
jgi:pantoate--beta-alanine ligase